MRMPGPWEIAVIVLILLVVFGAARLPQIGSSLGRSMRAFKDAITGEEDSESPKAKKKKAKVKVPTATAPELQEEPKAEAAAAPTKDEEQ